MSQYFAILKMDFANDEQILDFAKKCESFEMAAKHPLVEFVVLIDELKAIQESNGFIYPYCYQVTLLDINQAPLLLKFGSAICSDYQFVVKRSGYFDDAGTAVVTILDSQRVSRRKHFSGGEGYGGKNRLKVIQNIIAFLRVFYEQCKADWSVYEKRERLKEKRKEIEQQIENLQAELMTIDEELAL